ncbi:MAG: hypothetical protein HQL87_18490 [Magnetococcales bacterium]|nr:hypothetical protein [Magnetococcales bacterium]
MVDDHFPATKSPIQDKIREMALWEKLKKRNFPDDNAKKGFVDDRNLYFIPDKSPHGRVCTLRGVACDAIGTAEECVLKLRHELGGIYRFGVCYANQTEGFHYHVEGAEIEKHQLFCKRNNRKIVPKQKYINVHPNDWVRG